MTQLSARARAPGSPALRFAIGAAPAARCGTCIALLSLLPARSFWNVSVLDHRWTFVKPVSRTGRVARPPARPRLSRSRTRRAAEVGVGDFVDAPAPDAARRAGGRRARKWTRSGLGLGRLRDRGQSSMACGAPVDSHAA